MIKIAIAKGRISKVIYELLTESGYTFTENSKRKLIITDDSNSISIIYVKSEDVPIYVENSIADIGIVGKDILREKEYDVFEVEDLKTGKCDLCLAGYKNTNIRKLDNIRIASKYTTQAKEFLKSNNLIGKVIKLNGSVELAPLVGISDFIVDIVETGSTLKENNLEVLEVINTVSTRVIANKVSYKTKFSSITNFISTIN
ncbi:ATP phosphoribosyltransferase [Helicovermis profundi]|uniref:ATP phosphoribosyltransferase n=1 Tax=Helicovermis profundi TaxID=3065157 RepID=A0AAU9E9T9_9FIRM|nr:ATP phosphoribosyltransferase [Clostridia bacterium S502]